MCVGSLMFTSVPITCLRSDVDGLFLFEVRALLWKRLIPFHSFTPYDCKTIKPLIKCFIVLCLYCFTVCRSSNTNNTIKLISSLLALESCCHYWLGLSSHCLCGRLGSTRNVTVCCKSMPMTPLAYSLFRIFCLRFGNSNGWQHCAERSRS